MQRAGTLVIAVGLLLWAASNVGAQQVSGDVQKKLDEMMKRLEQQDKVIQSQGDKIQKQDEKIQDQDRVIQSLQKGGAKPAGAPGGAEGLTPKQEQKVDDLVKDYLSKDENRVSLGLEGIVAGYKDGFFLASHDQDYKLKVFGYMDIDGRFPDNGVPTASTFLVRRARPTVAGTLGKYYNFQVEPDFGMGKTTLMNAYIDLAYFGDLNTTRLGKFKVPQGMENLYPSKDTLFIENSQLRNINPTYDVGVMTYGRPWSGIVDYSFGVWNGDDRSTWQGNAADSDKDNGKSKDFGGRLQLSPFKTTNNFWFKGLQLAGWFNYGMEEDVPTTTQSVLTYTTGPGTTFFKTNPTTSVTVNKVTTTYPPTRAQGDRVRAGWDVGWLAGPIKFSAEWGVQSNRLSNWSSASTPVLLSQGTPDTQAWMIEAAWLLTGEDATFGRVKPKKDFDPKKKTWGAFELAARYSNLEIAQTMFEKGFAAPGSTDAVDEVTLGLNWYLNKNVKLMFNWEKSMFDTPIWVSPTSGAGPTRKQIYDEDAFMFRTQVQW